MPEENVSQKGVVSCSCGGGLLLVKDTMNIYRCDTCEKYYFVEPICKELTEEELVECKDRVAVVRKDNALIMDPSQLKKVVYSRPEVKE